MAVWTWWERIWKKKTAAERAAIITAAAIILAAIISTIRFLPSSNEVDNKPSVNQPAIENTDISTLTLDTGVGKPISSTLPKSFSIYPDYDPSGCIGDVGDVIVIREAQTVRFVYETKGQPSHEWEYKYVGNELNSDPCKFAGVMYLNPPNNWGDDPDGGYDLRTVSDIIKWEARSLTEKVNVEFVIGGVVWRWNDKVREKMPVPHPDTMRRKSLGIKTLVTGWQSFEADLSHIPEDEFKRVVGGFGWVINWDSNQVISIEQPKTFIIEIRNIRYEKR